MRKIFIPGNFSWNVLVEKWDANCFKKGLLEKRQGVPKSCAPPPPPINVTTLRHPTLMKNSDWPRFGTQPCTRLPVTFKSKNNNKQWWTLGYWGCAHNSSTKLAMGQFGSWGSQTAAPNSMYSGNTFFTS